MESLIQFLHSIVPAGLDTAGFLKSLIILLLGSLMLSILGRMLFGKKSTLSQSVSSAIGILFIYAITVAVHSFGLNLNFLLSPLPFISLSGDYLHVIRFADMNYITICDQLLGMIILAFLANLANNWMPKGKNLFTWFFFRCLSILLAILLHAITNQLLHLWLPEGLLVWAPVILLGLLVIMLAVGALKFLIGAVLTTVNPLIGFLYTFFFANVVGKQLSKAMLTTAILCGLVYGLGVAGWTTIFIGTSALAAYIPFPVILLVIWFLTGKVL